MKYRNDQCIPVHSGPHSYGQAGQSGLATAVGELLHVAINGMHAGTSTLRTVVNTMLWENGHSHQMHHCNGHFSQNQCCCHHLSCTKHHNYC
jgi:hypothetical protein